MQYMICKSIGAILFAGALITANTSVAQSVEVTNTTTTLEGTLSEFGPQSIIVRTETGAQPVRYISNETTNYVDEDGNPIGVTAVKSGLPVTVYYTKVGDTLVASKVMVRKVVTSPAPALETTHATITSAGTISEFGPGRLIIKTESSPEPLRYSYSKATTYVDENGQPVSINTVTSGLPVTVYYTKVGNTSVASKVIVRKAVTVPVPVVEQKKTTTTTTTTNKDKDD